MNKKELFLLESLIGLFVKVLEADKCLIQEMHWAILRLCISLTLGKKTHENMFQNRDLIRDEIEDENVHTLRMFIYKWIEYKNSEFTTSLTMLNSEPKSIEKNCMTGRTNRSSLLTKTLIRLTSNNQYDSPKGTKGYKTSPHRVFKPLELQKVTRYNSRIETDDENSSSRWESSAFHTPKNQNSPLGNNEYGLYRTEGSEEIGDDQEEDELQMSFSDKEGLPYILNGAGRYKESPMKRKDRENSRIKTLNYSSSRHNESLPHVPQNKTEILEKDIDLMNNNTQASSNQSSAKLGPTQYIKSGNSRVNELALAIGQLDEYEQDLLLEKLLEMKQKRQETLN